MKGEFKKRIIEIKNIYPTNPSVKMVCNDAMRFVDEAKKEFPKLTTGSFSKHPSGDIIDYYAKEVQKWFEKWFGVEK